MSLFLPSRRILSAGGSPLILDANFLTGVLDPRVTFSRNGNGGRYNASGLYEVMGTDVPRFDYDPVTLAAQGLLIESAEINRLIRSVEFNQWTQQGTDIVVNSASAPDGNTTADTLRETNGGTGHGLSLTAPIVSGQSYWLTAFVASDQHSFVQIAGGISTNAFGPDAWANFNLTLGTVGNQGPSVLGTFIQPVGNGFYLVGIRANALGSGGTQTATVVFSTNNFNTPIRAQSYSGTSAKQILKLWGGSCVQSAASRPGTYIPTVASTVTRNQDVATLSLSQSCDILVQDRNGGEWRPGVPSGAYNLLPRSGRIHVARVRAYRPGFAANNPGLAIAA